MTFFSTFKGKVLGAISVASAMATSASAAVDLSAVETSMTAGQGQLEGFAPTVIGFVLVIVIIGGFIKLTKRAA